MYNQQRYQAPLLFLCSSSSDYHESITRLIFCKITIFYPYKKKSIITFPHSSWISCSYKYPFISARISSFSYTMLPG